MWIFTLLMSDAGLTTHYKKIRIRASRQNVGDPYCVS